jgi:hypothetical protein
LTVIRSFPSKALDVDWIVLGSTSGGAIVDTDEDHWVLFNVDDVDVDVWECEGACCVSNDGPGGLAERGVADLAPNVLGSSEIFPAAMASS